MFCTVNEHLGNEEGIVCKANSAFKQLYLFLLFSAHFFPTDTLHFTSDLMFLYFFHRKDSPPGTSHESISDFLTLCPLNFFQSLLHREINV